MQVIRVADITIVEEHRQPAGIGIYDLSYSTLFTKHALTYLEAIAYLTTYMQPTQVNIVRARQILDKHLEQADA